MTDVTRLNALKEQSSWQERYKILITLSKTLDEYPIHLKDECHQVYGCENPVWIALWQQEDEDQLVFIAESQSRIVKGILAVILGLINHKSAAVISKMDIKKALEEYSIWGDLSDSRQSGMLKIIERIQSIASSYV